MKAANGDATKINITPQRPITLQNRSPNERSSSRMGESFEDWEDRHLCSIFRISLCPESKHDAHGNPLQYLAGTRAELEESSQPLRMNTSMLDQALLEAATNVGMNNTPLNYLLSCWKRVSRQHKVSRKNGEEDPKFKMAKEARRLCMSYCIFAVTMPEMFGCVSQHLVMLRS